MSMVISHTGFNSFQGRLSPQKQSFAEAISAFAFSVPKQDVLRKNKKLNKIILLKKK